MWLLYILECRDGRLYTGITNNIERRFQKHKEGKGGHFTRAFQPEKIIYQEQVSNRSEALKRESAVKKLSHEEKLELIKNK